MILYQIVMALALLPFLAREALVGAKGALAERLGFGPMPGGTGPRLWLHAASVGEVTSARWVIAALLAAAPGLQVLVTTNTATGRDRVRAWDLPGVRAALAPCDTAGAAARVLDRWQPQALVVVENELWPARLRACDNRGVPVLVIGARMSARSARRWGRFGAIARSVLGRIDWLSAQDADSLARFLGLGLPAGAVGPVVALKSIGQSQPAPPPFAPPAPRERCLLAASTHEGEEAMILAAFARQSRFTHLILAPRHPRRGDEIAALLAGRGIGFARRSRGEVPGPGLAVHLADTLGEMSLWYDMAGATLIGGTFADKGGHTPWEPARHGSAILHGSSVHNFAPAFAALHSAGAAHRITGAEDLAAALQALDPDEQSRLSTQAAQVLAPDPRGDEVVAGLMSVVKGERGDLGARGRL